MLSLLRPILLSTLAFISGLLASIPEAQKAKWQNAESLQKYIVRNKLPLTLEASLFINNKENFLDIAAFKQPNFSTENTSKYSVPSLYLFNAEGLLIDEHALGGCILNWPQFENSDYLTEILRTNALFYNDRMQTCTLDRLDGRLFNYKGEPIHLQANNKAVMLFIWAKNKTSFNGLRDYMVYTRHVLQQSKTPIEFYFLNVDNYRFE